MNLTRAAITNNRTTVIIILLMIVGGIYSYISMPKAEDPGFTIRVAQVITYYPGASPERVRKLVTEPLEDAIEGIPEVEEVRSQSKADVSIISVKIAFAYSNLDPIWSDLEEVVGSIAQDLPDGITGPYINDKFSDIYPILLTVSGRDFTLQELGDVAEGLKREIQKETQVGDVRIEGVPDEQITVRYDSSQLTNFRITPYQLASVMENTNIVRPGGSIRTSQERISIEPSGSFADLEALKSTLITIPGRQEVVPLSDIAEVVKEEKHPFDKYISANGEHAVLIAVNMKEGGNITTMGDQMRALIEDMKDHYPIGINFDFIVFQPSIVEDLISTFTSNVLQAMIIVLIVMFFFLGFREGILVASLVPLSMLTTLSIMKATGIWIDQMSLASLIIVLGMLVDNAIVITESTTVLMKEGMTVFDTSLKSVKELRIPLLTSSLTTAFAFLPIVMSQNQTGEFTRPLFWVVSITLLASWMISTTIIPFFAQRLLAKRYQGRKAKASQRKNKTSPSRFPAYYETLLARMLKHRGIVVLVLMAAFIGALCLFTRIPSSFFPTADFPVFTAEVVLPRGSSIERSAEVARDFDRFLTTERGADKGDVVSWGTFVGGGIPRFRLNVSPESARPEYIFIIINTSDYKDIEPLMAKIENYATTKHPDARLTQKRFTTGVEVDAPVEIRISGPERRQLMEIVGLLKAKLAETKGLKHIRDDWGADVKKLDITIDEELARKAGVSNQDIAISLQAATQGITVSQYRGDEEIIPIVLKDGAIDDRDIDRLSSLQTYAQSSGKAVNLSQVAGVDLLWQPAVIIRKDGLDTITVQAETTKDVSAIELADRIDSWLIKEKEHWPVGFSYEFGGEMEGSSDANKAIMREVPLAFLLILLLLVAQFNSLRRAFVILVTIPFGFIGVVIGLLVSGSPFSFMSLLGLVSLAGIVVNNAIILIDRIETERKNKGSLEKAIIVSASKRLWPILLTTTTTIGGLIPLMLFGGPLWLPMASAIIFGLGFSTILTLGFVPVLYHLLFSPRKGNPRKGASLR